LPSPFFWPFPSSSVKDGYVLLQVFFDHGIVFVVVAVIFFYDMIGTDQIVIIQVVDGLDNA
jgi:hypothetical protein